MKTRIIINNSFGVECSTTHIVTTRREPTVLVQCLLNEVAVAAVQCDAEPVNKSPKKKSKAKAEPVESEPAPDEGHPKDGRWTKEEHELFVEALKLYGKDWKKVQEHVGTRTTTQARSHAQKYFAKMGRKLGSDMNSGEGAESVETPADESRVHTQASTPVDSPLGGPCAPQKCEPVRSVSAKSSKKTLERTKAVSKRLLSFSDKDELAPATKTKTCETKPVSVSEPETRAQSQCPSAVPHFVQFEPAHFPLYYQQPFQIPNQMPSFVPMGVPGTSAESTLVPSYPECLTLCVPTAEESAILSEPAEALEFDKFQLDYVPEKPLDLGEETFRVPAKSEKNAAVDFSDLFA